jgi:hypothetical protein
MCTAFGVSSVDEAIGASAVGGDNEFSAARAVAPSSVDVLGGVCCSAFAEFDCSATPRASAPMLATTAVACSALNLFGEFSIGFLLNGY